MSEKDGGEQDGDHGDDTDRQDQWIQVEPEKKGYEPPRKEQR